MKKALIAMALVVLFSGLPAVKSQSRDQIRVTGSSSVFPFATRVAEEFARTTIFRAPIIEGIGTGGGLKLFCSGLGPQTPDIANASRPIKQSEIKLCRENGIDDIIEVKFGYDAIVLANSKLGPAISLTLREIYLALAAHVPVVGTMGQEIIANPYTRWSEINPDLPDTPIQVYGPPPTSGTRDAFNENALTTGCNTFKYIVELHHQDPEKYRSLCQHIREDGHYIETGENDNLIVQKLQSNSDAIGIFAYSFLDQNNDVLQAGRIARSEDAVATLPTPESIVSKDYPILRELFLYVKKAHTELIPGIREFVQSFLSEEASGEYGYLVDSGLIPLNDSERAFFQRLAAQLTTMNVAVP